MTTQARRQIKCRQSPAARPPDNKIIEPLDPASSARLRNRLWKGGFALALFITTLAVGNAFVPADKALSLRSAGHDFLAFYTAGAFVRTGQTADLYNLDAVRSFQETLAERQGLELGGDFAPYWNPPIFALAMAPLSRLSYPVAWWTWLGLNVACAIGAVLLLIRMLPAGAGWRTWGLIPLLIGASLPFVQSLGHGQNSCLSLLLLAAAVSLWRGERAIAAGAVTGILFYKPQLAVVASLALIATLGWRALAGLALTGTVLLLANLALLPGTLGDFLTRLPGNVHLMQVEQVYLWDRHVTLKAFWRFLLQGNTIGEASSAAQWLASLSVFIVAAAMVALLVRHRRMASAGPLHARHDGVIACAVLATPLLMPFYFDYDLLLLAVPATLLAGQWLAGRAGDASLSLPRARLWAWLSLYAWLFVNPHVARLTGVNLTVPLLALLTGLSMGAEMARSTIPALARRQEFEQQSPRMAA